MTGGHRGERDRASELIERWFSHRKEDPGPPPAQEPAADSTADPAPDAASEREATSTPPPPPDPAPITRRTGRSMNVDFTPRSGARRVVGVLLLLAVAGLIVAAPFAVSEPTTLTTGIAGVLLVLVLLLWAIRAASPVAHLSVRSGRLEVERGGERSVFELAQGVTPIEVRGRPGDRKWQVLFLRQGMEPFVIDSSMVDPHEFMEVLRRYRPE